MILMAEALDIVKKKLVNVIAELAKFADTYKDQPTLALLISSLRSQLPLESARLCGCRNF